MAFRSIPHWHNRTREGVKALLNKISLMIYYNLKKHSYEYKNYLEKSEQKQNQNQKQIQSKKKQK